MLPHRLIISYRSTSKANVTCIFTQQFQSGLSRFVLKTKGSAIAVGPRDAVGQLKSFQLLHSSAGNRT